MVEPPLAHPAAEINAIMQSVARRIGRRFFFQRQAARPNGATSNANHVVDGMKWFEDVAALLFATNSTLNVPVGVVGSVVMVSVLML